MIPDMTTGDSSHVPATRIGHKERDAAVERLRTAAGDGQITMDELETRMEAALEARTADDLAVLLADLPAEDGALYPSSGAGQSARIEVRHGKAERLGSWRVPEALELELRHGVCVLDLRSPVLPAGGVRIEASARHSSIRILVGHGTPVEMDDLVRAHSTTRDQGSRYVTQWSGPPVRISGTLQHSTVKILRPRRSWSERRRLRREHRLALGR
jgi:Domain of unknown function (DUF1707)